MLACIGPCWGENGISTVVLVFFVGQPATFAPVEPGLGAFAVVISAIVGLVPVPLFGWLADRFGRGPVFLSLSVFQRVVGPAV